VEERRKMVQKRNNLDPKAKAVIFLFTLLLIGAVVGVFVAKVSLDSVDNKTKANIVLLRGNIKVRGDSLKQVDLPLARQIWKDFSDIFTLVTIVICLNLFFIIGLLFLYLDSFRKTRSNFMLGLIMFLCVLFAQSLFSLPPVQMILGQFVFDLGLINIIPNLFETIALIILFYLSNE